jgi:hypothetical protein
MVDDYRKLLDDKDVDVVAIATPDYMACSNDNTCMSGRERCICGKAWFSYIDESRKMVQATKKI